MALPKEKGKAFERDIANILSKAFDAKFMRTAHSGAYTGGKNSNRLADIQSEVSKAFVSDIIPPDGYNVCIECKAYQELAFHQIIGGSCKLLDSWISEVKYDSKNTGNTYMLFFKINHKGIYVCLPSIGFSLILNKRDIPYTIYYVSNSNFNMPNMECKHIIISIDTFISLSDIIKDILTKE